MTEPKACSASGSSLTCWLATGVSNPYEPPLAPYDPLLPRKFEISLSASAADEAFGAINDIGLVITLIARV